MPLDTSIPLQVGQGTQVQQFNPMTMLDMQAQMQQRQENARYNAMREQLIQQEMQKNALAMQYGAEDRRAAAAQAAQAKAMLAQRNSILGRFGTTDAAVGAGPGLKYNNNSLNNNPFDYTASELIKSGDIGTAEALRKAQNEALTGRKTATETQGFDLKNIDSRLATLKGLAPMIDTPESAANFSKLVTQIVPEFNSIVGDPNAAAARNADAFAKDPEAWRTQVGALSAKDLAEMHQKATEALQPKPSQVSAGANLIDTNPRSPTYGQVVGSGQSVQPKAPTGYRYKDDGSLEAIPGGPAAQGEGTTLTPDALDTAAHTYILSGVLPPGMGKNAVATRTQIMNRAAELKGNQTPEQFAKAMRINKNDAPAMAKAEKDFSTGKQGQAVNAFNTAVDHLETLGSLSDALNNNDTKLINKAANSVSEQLGGEAPTNFNAAKRIVADEIVKAVVGAAGALGDRETAQASLDAANSPAQLKGVIDTYQKLMGGQLKSLKLQYSNTVGKNDFDTKLTPKAKAALDRVAGSAPAAVSTGNPEIDSLLGKYGQ